MPPFIAFLLSVLYVLAISAFAVPFVVGLTLWTLGRDQYLRLRGERPADTRAQVRGEVFEVFDDGQR